MQITLVQTNQKLDGGKFVSTKQDISVITELRYKAILNSSKVFRKIGGTCIHAKRETTLGFRVVKETLLSPCKKTKTIREFKFN